MKALKIFSAIILAVSVFTFGCKKSDDTATPTVKIVKGQVTFKNTATGTNDPAPYATVHISFNSDSVKTPYDENIETDANGNYIIVGLPINTKYFFNPDFTDSKGFYYSSFGVKVNLQNSKDTLTVNMLVQ